LYCVVLMENLLMSRATENISRRILFCCFSEVLKFGLSFSLVKVPCSLTGGFQQLNKSTAYDWPSGCRHQVFEMVTTNQTVWCHNP